MRSQHFNAAMAIAALATTGLALGSPAKAAVVSVSGYAGLPITGSPDYLFYSRHYSNSDAVNADPRAAGGGLRLSFQHETDFGDIRANAFAYQNGTAGTLADSNGQANVSVNANYRTQFTASRDGHVLAHMNIDPIKVYANVDGLGAKEQAGVWYFDLRRDGEIVAAETVIARVLAGSDNRPEDYLPITNGFDASAQHFRAFGVSGNAFGFESDAAEVTIDLGFAHVGESFWIDYTSQSSAGGVIASPKPYTEGCDAGMERCDAGTSFARGGDPFSLELAALDPARLDDRVAAFPVPRFSRIETVGGAGVPEPTAWALMILGFGAAGTMLRRRRGRDAPARRTTAFPGSLP